MITQMASETVCPISYHRLTVQHGAVLSAYTVVRSVSYTHLTLPTIYSV